VVLDPSGGEFDYMSRDVLVASSPELAKTMVELVTPYKTTRDYPHSCPM